MNNENIALMRELKFSIKDVLEAIELNKKHINMDDDFLDWFEGHCQALDFCIHNPPDRGTLFEVTENGLKKVQIEE